MTKSKIEWTEHTWNPVRGCTKISPGCKHCYAETFAERWRGVPGHPYEQGFDLRLVPEKLAEPLRRRKPTTWFVNSMSDLFHEDIPNEYIAAVFGVMAATPHHTYQVLTKRAERMPEWFRWYEGTSGAGASAAAAMWAAEETMKRLGDMDPNNPPPWPLDNVHLGVSVEGPDYLERLHDLMQTPASIRWVSLEPLLAGVDIRPWLGVECNHEDAYREYDTNVWICRPCEETPILDWVVVGGESGQRARPFDLSWARRIVVDCKAAGVPVFVKQLGDDPFLAASVHTRTIDTDIGGARVKMTFGSFDGETTVQLRAAKGGDISEWPEDLRVREWPTT